MKKTWIVWILGLCLLARLLPGLAVETQAVTAGTCGNDLTWMLDSEGTLTITGKGVIPDYTARSPAPWCGNIYDFVKAVEISRGVTQIGDYAFYKLSKLASITIPNSVNEIGENVFEDCRSLESVTIPEGVTRIAWHAFYNCHSLVDVTLPESVTDIGAYYYDAVLWAVENGITNGMGDGTFAPDATCTRGQIVTFLYRAMT